ncbi:MAG: DUF423 domain-containing protein [Gammaproteobacteria bacterium]|jgi:uncharacterized membrane protein YgdD (TMEM256/DUF423 family)
MRFSELLTVTAGLFGASAVALGAVGSHALRQRLPTADYEIFALATVYLLVHAGVLFGCGTAARRAERAAPFAVAGLLLIVGILLFCGGLMGRTVLGIPALGRLAPIGGSALMLGWLAIAAAGVLNYWRSR